MKTIPLTQGQVALVDDDDAEWLSLRKWQANWDRDTKRYYAMTNIWRNGKRTRVSMARTIMNTVHFLQCDHKNHDTLDNRRKNLRNVTPRQNSENRLDQSKLGVGVCRTPGCKVSFRSFVRINGKNKYFGPFRTPEEARKACQYFLESYE